MLTEIEINTRCAARERNLERPSHLELDIACAMGLYECAWWVDKQIKSTLS